MKKYFTIDFAKLAQLLVPPMLRKPLLLTLLWAMYTPMRGISDWFGTNREANLYHLGITPQVVYLEKLLNDRFDSVARRIYIADGVYYDLEYIYTEGESIDLYTRTEGEAEVIYLYTPAESGADGADFIVHVPATIGTQNKEMHTLLDQFKLASKRYIITSI